MKTFIYFFICLAVILSFEQSCSFASDRPDINDTLSFVGSTPGDDFIKSRLGIDKNIKVDFIKWDLKLGEYKFDFVLNIIFGESQPNTLGFKNGGQRRTYKGYVTTSKYFDNPIYHLEFDQFKTEISMVRVTDNLWHLLTPDKILMIGNGGWSYTLNNKNPVKYPGYLATLSYPIQLNESLRQVVYDGRTPCQDFAKELQMNASPDCFKLKWRLTLNRDSVTYQPSTYTMRTIIDNIPSEVSGNWKIIKGSGSNSHVVIYQLEREQPGQTISLMVGDGNVLFFIKKDQDLFIGNDNFSFTMNRKLK